MSPFRLAALLPFVAAAGCYAEAAPQSTLPEPHYVSGPPGGAMDPGTAYDPNDTGDGFDAIEDTGAAAPAPSATADAGDDSAPDVAAASVDPDDADGDQPGEAVAEAPPAGGDAADPTATVTDDEINGALDGYGQWIDTDDYGPVWRPDATVVGVDFTPYETGGSWAYTDAGWAFACDYPWGWLPFHYGRWGWFHGYWGWVPGHRWSPAWVEWRHGGGVVGWRPLRPRIHDHRHDPGGGHRFGSGALVRDHRRAEQHAANWRFARVGDFGRPHIRSHLFGNPAEGLRVTTKVAAPPLRARTSIRAADLMRDRVSAGARVPGRFSAPSAVRDHRSFAPARPPTQPPAQAARPPTRFYPNNPNFRPQQPVRTQPPQAFRPPNAQPYPPPRNYRPPVYSPPVRTAPPAGNGSFNRPPAGNYRPPAGSAPPVRTYQPPPVRNSTPPSHSAPPARSYSPPPSHSSPPPASSSSHSSSSSSSSHSSSSSSSSGHHR